MSKQKSSGVILTPVPNWPPSSILESGRLYRPTVGVDLHQTVVDFFAGFGPWLEAQYPGAKIDVATLQHYNPAGDPKVGIGYEEFDRALNMYIQLAIGGYDSFPALPGAIEGLKAIRAAGIDVEIMTYVPGASFIQRTDKLPLNTGIARDLTCKLLNKLGFKVEPTEIAYMFTNDKPYHMIGNQIPLLVEDNRTTASHVADMGLAALLIPTSYNVCSMPNVLRLEDREDKAAIWQEAAARIVEFYVALAKAGKLISTGGK